MEWVASTLHTTSEHGVSSITTADAHNSAASSRLNWRPPADLNGLVRFARKTKSGSCACAITFQLVSTLLQRTRILLWVPHCLLGRSNDGVGRLRRRTFRPRPVVHKMTLIQFFFPALGFSLSLSFRHCCTSFPFVPPRYIILAKHGTTHTHTHTHIHSHTHTHNTHTLTHHTHTLTYTHSHTHHTHTQPTIHTTHTLTHTHHTHTHSYTHHTHAHTHTHTHTPHTHSNTSILNTQ